MAHRRPNASGQISLAHVNLTNLKFLVADGNSFYRDLSRRILRGFGAAEVFEAADAVRTKALMRQKQIDVLICDAELEDDTGFEVVHAIRMEQNHPLRNIPMLISTGTTRRIDVNLARNAGANIVIKKPMAPAVLYDRLVWISRNPRPFWASGSYFGPDRRVRDTAGFRGEDRRKGEMTETQIDEIFEVGAEDAA